MKEVLIKVGNRFYVVCLGLASLHPKDDPTPCWCDPESGKIICPIGQESRLFDLGDLEHGR